MQSTSQAPKLRKPILRVRTHRIDNRFFAVALFLSILIHLSFVYSSHFIRVSDIHNIERNVETLFKVKLEQLESHEFVSRPSNEQLRQEREQVLRDEITRMSQITPRSAEGLITSSIPQLNPGVLAATLQPERLNQSQGAPQTGAAFQGTTQPGLSSDEEDFEDDQIARKLVTSDKGKRAVQDFEMEAGKDSVKDPVSNKRIPLTGRGAGSTRRLLDNLPQPPKRTDPVVSRSIAMVLLSGAAPPTPDLTVAEPPIELPPISELLPSPSLLQAGPGPASLKDEEKAREKMRDRFVPLDDLLNIELYTYHHIGGDGYFMIRVRPKNSDQRLRILPKDIVFVLDASASMGRRRIEVVKDEIHGILERLRPEDRFNIIGFKQNVQRFTRTLAPAVAENLDPAWQFIRPLEASGRTDIYSSLQPLVQLGTERARPLILLLFSDGRPTVGVLNSRNIIKNLTRFRGPSTSIYCIGTGEVLNHYLLEMLAYMNRGLVAYERDRQALPTVMRSVYGYIEDPVLLHLSADFTTVDANDVYPKILPDLFLKGDFRMWGRLKDENKITFRLLGEAWDEHKEMIVELPVPKRDNGSYEIARDWAFHKIYDLIGRMVEEGEKPEYLETVRSLSRTYQVTTPYSDMFNRS